MTINQAKNGSKLTVTLEGRLDTTTAPQLEEVVRTALDGVTDLVSGVEMPGYNELISYWNELHPNVEVVVETCPWDSWLPVPDITVS